MIFTLTTVVAVVSLQTLQSYFVPCRVCRPFVVSYCIFESIFWYIDMHSDCQGPELLSVKNLRNPDNVLVKGLHVRKILWRVLMLIFVVHNIISICLKKNRSHLLLLHISARCPVIQILQTGVPVITKCCQF